MRILNTDTRSIVLGAVLSLALNVGATAQSGPSATESQSSKPSAEQPASPEQAPANQQPSTTDSGAQTAAPSSGAQSSPQQGAQQNGSTSVDDELQLTDDQKQRIAVIVDDENKQISAVRDDNAISMEQKQQKALAIRQAATPKIKAVLTPDQLQKLAAIQQRMRSQQGSQQPQDSGPSAPSNSPSNPQN